MKNPVFKFDIRFSQKNVKGEIEIKDSKGCDPVPMVASHLLTKIADEHPDILACDGLNLKMWRAGKR